MTSSNFVQGKMLGCPITSIVQIWVMKLHRPTAKASVVHLIKITYECMRGQRARQEVRLSHLEHLDPIIAPSLRT